MKSVGVALLWIAPLLATAGVDAQPEPSAKGARPNIVLIMADDMGYTDIGCYGGEIATPVLDGLAAKGLRFTQFYNTSRCCPTRAALLTGLYSHQAGIGLMMSDRGYPAYRGDLNRNCLTLAEYLKLAGYRTMMSGKWHVTRQIAPDGDRGNWPLQRGFDRFYGTITGAGSFYDPATLCRGNRLITPANDPEYRPATFHYTDAISDNAVQFLAEQAGREAAEPFFLYVAYTSAHWPMHAPDRFIEQTRGRYQEGYAPIRTARWQRARQLGVVPDHAALSPTVGDWEQVAHRKWEIRCMEVYAAMVMQMDAGIGRIVQQLESMNALDNTLIVYLQDNGGCGEGMGRSSNADQLEDQSYRPLAADDLQAQIWPPMQTRDGRPVRTGPEVMPGPEDSYVAYGRNWANVSNTPFRGFKHDALEGGIRSPLIVHWPAGISKEIEGGLAFEPCHLIDWMPTLVELASVPFPESHQGHALLPLEGISLCAALKGRPFQPQRGIGFEHHGNLAWREGDWKIVSQYTKQNPIRWELYQLAHDPTELHDLAAVEPERVREMAERWQSWADRVGVQPWPIQPPAQEPR